MESRELEDPRYASNPGNRCYYCKSELFTLLEAEARTSGFGTLAYGANIDDQGDFRPGMTAAREFGVVAPLIEAGLGKPQIRAIARELGLPTGQASRLSVLPIPHVVKVTATTGPRREVGSRADRAWFHQ